MPFTYALGATTSIGGYNVNWVEMDLSRKGDSLVGTWQGRAVVFVKRR